MQIGDKPVPDATKPVPNAHGLVSFLVDFGPLLVFFLVFRLTRDGDGAAAASAAAVRGTAAFMVAIVIAMAVARWRLGRISPMLWLSGVLVLGFGALTVWLDDERFIQLKPTIIYAGFAVILLGGWLRGKALLRMMLETAYPGLSRTGWLLLSRNWGLFFAGMALLNEAMRHLADFDLWLTLKVWAVLPLTFGFTLSQIPLMMRHGMEGAGDGPPPTPPQG